MAVALTAAFSHLKDPAYGVIVSVESRPILAHSSGLGILVHAIAEAYLAVIVMMTIVAWFASIVFGRALPRSCAGSQIPLCVGAVP
jgi:hypothetical protein